MNARDDIRRRVSQGVAGGARGDFAARRAAAVAALGASLRGPQPVMAADLAGRFRTRAESQACTVFSVPGWAQAPQAVADYLADRQTGEAIVAGAELAGLDWVGVGLNVVVRPTRDADRVGLTACFCAIAETGTLVLLSGAPTPATVSLLPETHIALVDLSRLVATMEDAFALLRAERGAPPRAVNFIAGPSRTGDIEQTIVLGAHGPCRVHIILIG